MADKIPPASFDSFDTIGAAKPIKDAGGKASTDSFMIPLAKLNIIEDFNIRIDSPARKAHIAALVESFREHGYRRSKPIEVLADADGTLFITDGHARYEALMAYNAANKQKIDTVPVVAVPQNSSVQDITAAFVTSNSGLALTPMEIGIVCARLKQYGQMEPAIAKSLGLTTKYVKDLLMLVDAPAAVRAMVAANKVAPTTAIAAIREHGADAAKVLKEAASAMVAEGKDGRVTPKAVKAAGGKKAAPTGVSVIQFKAGQTYPNMEIASVESLPGDDWFGVVDDRNARALRNIKITIKVGKMKTELVEEV